MLVCLMPWSRRNHFWRPFRRRLPAGLVLVAYLAATLGLPVSPSVSKDLRQPFPCQDHTCGCRTAADCWRHCCCFSPEEKLAWARARAVTPPPDAEQPTSQGWHTTRLRDQEEGPKRPTGGCAHCESPARKTERCPPASPNCCAKPRDVRSCCQTGSPRPVESSHCDEPTGHRWGFSLSALRCQGLSSWWVGSQALLPPPPGVTWSPNWVCTDRLSYSPSTPVVLFHSPPDPPPRYPST